MERTKFKSKTKEPPNILIPKIPKRVYDILSSNALKLYMFYRYMVKHQNTDQIYATDIFCRNKKGLGWGKDRFYVAKKELEQFGLIKTIQTRRKDGAFGKKYIKVFFVMDENKLITAEIHRRTGGKSIYTKSTKSKLKTSVSSVERSSKAPEIHRRTGEPEYGKQYTNALKKHNKQTTSGINPPGVIPSVRKNIEEEEEDNLPFEKETGNLPLSKEDLPKCLKGYTDETFPDDEGETCHTCQFEQRCTFLD